MVPYLSYTIQDSTFYLSHERVIFWKERKSLIAADIHFGKTGHFRKSGIGVPASAYKDDLQRLFKLLIYFKADHLIVVGDMFHSSYNKEFELFKKWRRDCSSLSIDLIRGNHDIVNQVWYEEAEIQTFESRTYDQKFSFIHDIATLEDGNKEHFVFSGHLHPAITLKGKSRQSLSFPCFSFNEHSAVLPAFSYFSGHYNIRPSVNESIFAIVDKSVIKINY